MISHQAYFEKGEVRRIQHFFLFVFAFFEDQHPDSGIAAQYLPKF